MTVLMRIPQRETLRVMVVPGKDGTSFKPDLVVATYADLPTGLGIADNGYSVLVQADQRVYFWSGTAWPAEGDGILLKGDKGDTGDAGRGIDDIEVSGNSLVFDMSDATQDTVPIPALSAADDAATAAAVSAQAALESQNAAAASESAAASSASNAHTSETNAAGSAAAADASAEDASDSEDAALASKNAAAGSASAAAGSATTASTAATNAGNAQTAAQTAATNAGNSATSASTSASNASGSASAAASSETNAANSEANAADSADTAEYWAQQAADTVGSGVPAAGPTTKGGIMLPGGVDGELGGTYDHPVVTGWSKKADLVGGKIPSSQIPAQATHETEVVTTTAERLALTSDDVQPGDNCVQTGDPGRGTYVLQDPDPSQPSSWVLLVAPTDSVSSVNGQTGVVNLGKGDIGLGNVNNTADVDKPVSTAQQTALDGKVGTGRKVSAGTGLTGGGDLTADRTLAVSYGTTAGTACQGNDSRLSDTRTPTDGSVTSAKLDSTLTTAIGKANSAMQKTDVPADLSMIVFGANTTRATGTGDNPFGIKVKRAITLTEFSARCATADASGNLSVKLQKNGADISGATVTVAYNNQVGGGSTGSLSVSLAAGDVLTAVVTGIGATPGKGLAIDCTAVLA